jgi:soluble lytic murein transglycosylase-like protein
MERPSIIDRLFQDEATHTMRRIYLLLTVSAACFAQTPESLLAQRASVMKQIEKVTGKLAPPATSFFTVPWTGAPASFATADCEPLPAARLDQLVQQSSQREAVDPDLIRAVIHQESGNKPCAVSSMGAQGLMQLMPDTASELGVHDPFDPKENVEAGTKLLKQLLAKYNGDVSLALSAYNAGETRVDREGGVPPISETMNYVFSILTKLAKR